MSELQNPIFDEEKEFLERKKLEYERALRGDVDHIKEQSVKAGKVALVGAGLAGTVWLISKAFGGKKRRPEGDSDGKGRGKDKGEPKDKRKSAAASAMVFMDHLEEGDHEFGGGVSRSNVRPPSGAISAQPVGALAHANERVADKPAAKPVAPTSKAAEKAEKPSASKAASAQPSSTDEDPFQDLPYDDSRRLPASHAFDEDAKNIKGKPTSAMNAAPHNSVARVVGSVLQQFLQSDTGKVLVAQAGALALATVTKKAGEFFPADKNADLAASSDVPKASPATSPVASSAPSAAPDASKPPKSV